MVVLNLIFIFCAVVGGAYLVNVMARRGVQKYIDHILRQERHDHTTLAQGDGIETPTTKTSQ